MNQDVEKGGVHAKPCTPQPSPEPTATNPSTRAIMTSEDKQDKVSDIFEIPQVLIERLKGLGPRFCLVKARDKDPSVGGQGWQKLENLMYAEDPRLQGHLQRGGNYGVVAGFGLAILDADHPEVKEIVQSRFPSSFTDESPGHKGLHYFFLSNLTGKMYLRTENGEHAGEILWEGFMVVGPGSVHPNGQRYRIINDEPLATISKDQLTVLLGDHLVPEKQVTQVEEAAREERQQSRVDLDILQVVPLTGLQKRGPEYFGPHPVHGSETGQNFHVNASKNCWHCFRHGSGGGPLLWLAVEEGIIDCSQAGPGALRGNLFKKTLEKAVERGLIEGRKPTAGSAREGNVKSEEEGKRESQANHMVTLAIESSTELFHDDSRNCYAKITHSDAASILRIRSKEFKILLSKLLWEARNKAPSGEALNSAINVLESKALFEGAQHKLYNRVAPDPDGDGIWIDMCNDKWQAIKVTAEDWQIVDKPPVLFRRYSHQQPLVTPTRGGDPNLFFRFVNLAEDNEDTRILLIITVIHFLIPEIPHVILTLYGIQGAAKTTLLKLIRELIDPSSLGVLSIPRDEREMVQQLSHNWCAFYDNVGMLSWWQSDSLCRATTGGGFSKRELWSDDDDVIYNFYRCLGLNGINIAAQRPDLLDRCLLMGLKHIPKDKRKTEKTLWREFNKVKGEILGGFLDTLSKAIKNYPTINLEQLYRMADFTKWGCAISEALGIDQKKFLSAYDASVESQIEEAAHSSPVAEVIPKFMDRRREWEGSPSELYSKLVETAKEMGVSVRQKAWPKAPNSLIRSINELVPALKQLGYEVETKRRSGGARLVRINTVTTVTIALDHENDGKLGIDAGDDVQGNKIPSLIPSPKTDGKTPSSDGSDANDGTFQSFSGVQTTPPEPLAEVGGEVPVTPKTGDVGLKHGRRLSLQEFYQAFRQARSEGFTEIEFLKFAGGSGYTEEEAELLLKRDEGVDFLKVADGGYVWL